jgi:hypothetical protein
MDRRRIVVTISGEDMKMEAFGFPDGGCKNTIKDMVSKMNVKTVTTKDKMAIADLKVPAEVSLDG